MAATFAMPAGRLGGRIGQRPVTALGGLVFAAGFVYILASVSATPAYLSSFLPGFMLGGTGIGMVLGTLPAAVTAGLPAERFATGTAVFGMARQLGSAIGVAVLVALLSASGADLLGGLRSGWTFSLGTGVVTMGLALAFGPVNASSAQSEPAELAVAQGAA